MPRIRTIKPEFWTDPEILGLSFEARLFFIGLWNFSDDYGNIEGHPIKLKSLIFPADPFSSEEISVLLEDLQGRDLVRPYEAGRKCYFNIRTFLKHQKINRRSKLLRNPPSPWDDDEVSTHGGLTEDSLPEGNSKGGEGRVNSCCASDNGNESDSEPLHSDEDSEPPLLPEEDEINNQTWLNRAWLDATGKLPNNVQAEEFLTLLHGGSVSRAQLEEALLETGKKGPEHPFNYFMAVVERIKTGEADNRPDCAPGYHATIREPLGTESERFQSPPPEEIRAIAGGSLAGRKPEVQGSVDPDPWD